MLEKLIISAVNMLLDGENEVLNNLRDQFRDSEMISIDNTGVGMFVDFKTSRNSLKLNGGGIKDDFAFGDVFGTIDGVFGAIGFIIFVQNGFLKSLEIYSIGEKYWSGVTDDTEISFDMIPRNMKALELSWRN